MAAHGNLGTVRAALFDLDGVFHVGDRLLPGAAATLAFLRERGIPFRIITNTTTRSRASLTEKLRRLGLPLAPGDLITAPYAGALYLRARPDARCRFVMTADARGEFAAFADCDDRPDLIVLGDIEDQVSYALLNSLFNQIMSGAELIALHKGRYWQVPEGLKVDLGLFVAGLEYTTGKPATIIGKPAPLIFEMAMRELNVTPTDCIMIGDDLVNDIGGAQALGIRGVLVRTGKYRHDDESRGTIIPDLVIDSLFGLPELLGR